MSNALAGLTIGACVTVLISAGLLANAIENQKQPGYSDAGRWTLQQTYDDGWLLFDSETGRLCSVPNAKNPNQQTHCTTRPTAY
jgi:hypothetical protein